MRGRVATALVAALLLAGCSSAGLPEAVQPRLPATPWTSWTGPIASLSGGCGFCMGPAAQAPEYVWVGTDEAGRVLRFEWGSTEAAGVSFAEGLDGWRPIVEPLLAPGDEYGQTGQWGAHVYALQNDWLAPGDWSDIGPVFAAARKHLQPLGEPVYDCVDCGAPVLKANGLRVQLSNNAPDGSGWPVLSQQLSYLGVWAAADSKPSCVQQGSQWRCAAS